MSQEEVEEAVAKAQELEEKLEAVAQAVEEAGDGEDKGNQLQNNGFLAIDTAERQQIVHYIRIEETDSFESCDEILTAKDAQKAFMEASKFRDPEEKCTEEKCAESPQFRKVAHGDILILECQGKKKGDPEYVGGGEFEETEEGDGCYYIGMCSKVDIGRFGATSGYQEQDPFPVTAEEKAPEDEEVISRNFMAWHTCGGSDNFAFEIPEEFPESMFCKGSIVENGTPEVVGVNLTLQKNITDAHDGEEFNGKKAFLPIQNESDPCPVTETITIRELFNTDELSSYASTGACTVSSGDDGGTAEVTLTLPIKKTEMIFKGGLLMQKTQTEYSDGSDGNMVIKFSVPCGDGNFVDDGVIHQIEVCNEDGVAGTLDVKVYGSSFPEEDDG
tara:strand:+ start:822 stop:1985 length:1164 start_codon:yes stop_codon:yes gene_type:complete